MNKLFITLTREDAIALRQLDNGHDHRYRIRQIEKLEDYLNKRGYYSSYETAALEMLKNMVPYSLIIERSNGTAYPECVYRAYYTMFNAFDEMLQDIIGDHYKLQGLSGPDGKIIWSEDHYDEVEATDSYNEVAEDRTEYVRLCKVDKMGIPIDIIYTNF